MTTSFNLITDFGKYIMDDVHKNIDTLDLSKYTFIDEKYEIMKTLCQTYDKMLSTIDEFTIMVYNNDTKSLEQISDKYGFDYSKCKNEFDLIDIEQFKKDNAWKIIYHTETGQNNLTHVIKFINTPDWLNYINIATMINYDVQLQLSKKLLKIKVKYKGDKITFKTFLKKNYNKLLQLSIDEMVVDDILSGSKKKIQEIVSKVEKEYR